jgi:hypothetical protein
LSFQRTSLLAVCVCLISGLAFAEEGQVDKKKKPKVIFNARVMTGFEVEHDRPAERQSGKENTDYAFFLQQARVKVKVRFNPAIRLNVSADLSDALDFIEDTESDSDNYSISGRDDRLPFLRNAYLNLRAHDAFQVRAGRFKRPYSRLENRSTGVLPLRGRGLSNDLLIEDAKWGDRALGLMLWGRVKPAKLTWRVAASNPGWESFKEEEKLGVNLQGRLAYAATEWLSIGVNGGHMWAVYDEIDQPDISQGAIGGDVRVNVGDFYLAAEVIAAQRRIADDSVIDPETNEPIVRTRDPFGLGATLYLNYDIGLPHDLILQPAAFAEYAD